MTWTWRDSGLLAAGAVGRLVDAQRVKRVNHSSTLELCFFPTVSKYKVGILTVWHQAMLGLGLGQRALGRLCSSFGNLK